MHLQLLRLQHSLRPRPEELHHAQDHADSPALLARRRRGEPPLLHAPALCEVQRPRQGSGHAAARPASPAERLLPRNQHRFFGIPQIEPNCVPAAKASQGELRGLLNLGL